MQWPVLFQPTAGNGRNLKTAGVFCSFKRDLSSSALPSFKHRIHPNMTVMVTWLMWINPVVQYPFHTHSLAYTGDENLVCLVEYRQKKDYWTLEILLHENVELSPADCFRRRIRESALPVTRLWWCKPVFRSLVSGLQILYEIGQQQNIQVPSTKGVKQYSKDITGYFPLF